MDIKKLPKTEFASAVAQIAGEKHIEVQEILDSIEAGLISAYKTAAQMALEESVIQEKTIDVQFQISFDYKNMNKVMRIIKEKNLEIISQQMKESCQIIIATRKKNAEIIFDIFFNLFEIEIKKFNHS
jgi:putative IMPACT (imprinted ancient) family translation regulator